MSLLRHTCPLSCGAVTDARVVEAGELIVFICPECLGVAFDAAILADPRRNIDLTRIFRPIVENIRRENAIDPLTQTKSRAFFFHRLAAEIATASHRFFISIAAFAFDIEGIYIRFGAQRGDIVVKNLAASLLSAIRTGDDLARIDPGIFGLILRNSDTESAAEISDRIAKSVCLVTPGNGKPIDIGLTVAVAGADGKSADAAWRDVIEVLRANRLTP
ncbi:MAG: diguanylate cyclase [Candidatus Hydrogenedentota bacterium]